SVGQALELQARIAKKAYDTYVSELTKLGQMIFSGYQTFLNRAEEQLPNAGHSGAQRTAAHRVSSSRKTGVATRRNSRRSRAGRTKYRARSGGHKRSPGDGVPKALPRCHRNS